MAVAGIATPASAVSCPPAGRAISWEVLRIGRLAHGQQSHRPPTASAPPTALAATSTGRSPSRASRRRPHHRCVGYWRGGRSVAVVDPSAAPVSASSPVRCDRPGRAERQPLLLFRAGWVLSAARSRPTAEVPSAGPPSWSRALAQARRIAGAPSRRSTEARRGAEAMLAVGVAASPAAAGVAAVAAPPGAAALPEAAGAAAPPGAAGAAAPPGAAGAAGAPVVRATWAGRAARVERARLAPCELPAPSATSGGRASPVVGREPSRRRLARRSGPSAARLAGRRPPVPAVPRDPAGTAAAAPAGRWTASVGGRRVPRSSGLRSSGLRSSGLRSSGLRSSGRESPFLHQMPNACQKRPDLQFRSYPRHPYRPGRRDRTGSG
jgi:hypothetical protein